MTTAQKESPRRQGTNRAAGAQGDDTTQPLKEPSMSTTTHYPAHVTTPVTTIYPAKIDRTLADLLARDYNADLQLDPHFEHGQCEWCGEMDRITQFRIERRPAGTTTTTDVGACLWCFTTVLDVARRELADNDHSPVVIYKPTPGAVLEAAR